MFKQTQAVQKLHTAALERAKKNPDFCKPNT